MLAFASMTTQKFVEHDNSKKTSPQFFWSWSFFIQNTLKDKRYSFFERGPMRFAIIHTPSFGSPFSLTTRLNKESIFCADSLSFTHLETSQPVACSHSLSISNMLPPIHEKKRAERQSHLSGKRQPAHNQSRVCPQIHRPSLYH